MFHHDVLALFLRQPALNKRSGKLFFVTRKLALQAFCNFPDVLTSRDRRHAERDSQLYLTCIANYYATICKRNLCVDKWG